LYQELNALEIDVFTPPKELVDVSELRAFMRGVIRSTKVMEVKRIVQHLEHKLVVDLDNAAARKHEEVHSPYHTREGGDQGGEAGGTKTTGTKTTGTKTTGTKTTGTNTTGTNTTGTKTTGTKNTGTKNTAPEASFQIKLFASSGKSAEVTTTTTTNEEETTTGEDLEETDFAQHDHLYYLSRAIQRAAIEMTIAIESSEMWQEICRLYNSSSRDSTLTWVDFLWLADHS
jgi:hypothetical protein